MAEDVTLIDRESEIRELRALGRSNSPSLGLLYGRRRVGKTFLLQHAWRPDEVFYFLASDTTTEMNRQDLLRELSTWAGKEIEAEDYPTWRTVFRLLTGLKGNRRLIAILDEFQYLLEGDDSVDSQLVSVWDQLPPGAPICLILCGSAVRIMERLDAGNMALHGRFKWKHKLKPFDYWDTARMATFKNLRSRAEAYGAFGGTPRYLATLDSSKSLKANLARVFLPPQGEVRTQVESLIEQEGGLTKTAEYRAILSAVGSGRTEVNEIAMRIGAEHSNEVKYMLNRLVDLGYLERRRNFEASRNQPYRYYLDDPALRFYYGLVRRYRSELEIYVPAEIWKEHMAEAFNTYMGYIFERIAEEAFKRLADDFGFPMVRDWDRWEGKDKQGKPVEIDVVARIDRKRIMTGSVKWNRKPVGPALHTEHIRSLQRLASSGQGWASEALESRSPLLYAAAGGFEAGFAESARADGRDVYLMTLEDMYKGLT